MSKKGTNVGVEELYRDDESIDIVNVNGKKYFMPKDDYSKGNYSDMYGDKFDNYRDASYSSKRKWGQNIGDGLLKGVFNVASAVSGGFATMCVDKILETSTNVLKDPSCVSSVTDSVTNFVTNKMSTSSERLVRSIKSINNSVDTKFVINSIKNNASVEKITVISFDGTSYYGIRRNGLINYYEPDPIVTEQAKSIFERFDDRRYATENDYHNYIVYECSSNRKDYANVEASTVEDRMILQKRSSINGEIHNENKVFRKYFKKADMIFYDNIEELKNDVRRYSIQNLFSIVETGDRFSVTNGATIHINNLSSDKTVYALHRSKIMEMKPLGDLDVNKDFGYDNPSNFYSKDDIILSYSYTYNDKTGTNKFELDEGRVVITKGMLEDKTSNDYKKYYREGIIYLKELGMVLFTSYTAAQEFLEKYETYEDFIVAKTKSKWSKKVRGLLTDDIKDIIIKGLMVVGAALGAWILKNINDILNSRKAAYSVFKFMKFAFN